jgi:antitoxin component of MazEF toxin-antitoxin module
MQRAGLADGVEVEFDVADGKVVMSARSRVLAKRRALYEQMLRDFVEKGPPDTILREGLRGRERDILND